MRAPVCVQIDDMQEFDKKYNEAMAMLEDIYTRLFDHMSLWTDEWHMLSDGEKSVFCPKSSAEIVDTAVEIADTSPAELDTPPQTETSAFEDTAAVVPRSAVSLNHGAQTGTAASRPETGNVDDDDDDDYAASKGKDWNCYTVLIREGLAAIHLAKVDLCKCKQSRTVSVCVSDLAPVFLTISAKFTVLSEV